MAGAPRGAPECGAKPATGEDDQGHSTMRGTASLNTLEVRSKSTLKAAGCDRQGGAASRRCPCPEAADAKGAQHPQQRSAGKQEKEPFFYERRKRKRQRLDPCAAILARHIYGDDAAESCVIPEGIVSVYEAPPETESTQNRMSAFRALSSISNVACKKTEKTEGEGETCKKRKRLEEVLGAFKEGGGDSPR
ncbi:hypothetical protein ACSSS7_001500 [Eimeria intestinalis]